MNCARCGEMAGYNRVAVGLVSGQVIGGFCRNCELEEFGRTLSKRSRPYDGCLFCSRDGTYAIAVWEPVTREVGPDLICDVEYSVTDRTPTLCDEHFHELCPEQNRIEAMATMVE